MALNEISEFDAIVMHVLLRLGMQQKNVARIFNLTPAAICNRLKRMKAKNVVASWTMRELEAVIASHRNEWREVPAFKNRVWVHPSGLVRTRRKLIKTHLNGMGYLHFCLDNGKTKLNLRVHRLVAEAFLGPCPKGLVVHHKDANKENNAASNLEYVTQKENTRHAIERGVHYSVRQRFVWQAALGRLSKHAV